MKTIKRFLFLVSASALTLLTTAGVNPTTAWFNNETFESYTLLQDLTTAGASPYSGWTKNAGSALIQSSTAFNYSANASGQYLGFSMSTVNTITESAVSGNRYFYKTFPNALNDIVYGKMAFFTCTGGSSYSPYYGTDYQLKDASGNIVFEFGGMSATSNALWMTGVPSATMALGARAKWADIEFVLDVPNKKIVKAKMSYNGTSKTFTNLPLSFNSAITQLYVHENRGYAAGAIDNVTLGQLTSDSISNINGDVTIQTLSGQPVTKNYKVDLTATVLDSLLVMNSVNENISWTISNWGTLSTADQALISLKRDSADTRNAVLNVGSISADGTITIQAAYGSSTRTINVALKAVSLEALKNTLTDKANAGKALVSGVSEVNPYITAEKTKLNTVISNSEYMVKSVSSTIELVTLGLSNQEAANTAFGAAMAVYADFGTSIGTVQATHDAEVRTAAFFTAIKATLQTAIDVAKAAKATVATAEDIAAAKTAVLAAETQFKADVPNYAALETQIASVSSRLAVVTPRAGDYFLNYDATAVGSLTGAKTTADGVLAAATTATQLSDSKTTLASALSTFNAVPRKVADKDARYRIYTYGVNDGDGDTIKKVINVVEGLDSLGIDTLNYAAIDHVGAVNLDWKIETTATGYVFQNVATKSYLAGAILSNTSVEVTLPENTSQGGLIKANNDTYFFYSVINASGKALEVDVFNTNTGLGVFKSNSSTAPRMRFAFQFEQQSPATEVLKEKVQSLKAFALDHSLVIAGLENGQHYAVYSISGLMVKSGKANVGLMQFDLPAGVYIVKVADQIVKAVVK